MISDFNTRLTTTVPRLAADEIGALAAKERRTVSAMVAVLLAEAIKARTCPPVYVDPLADANGNRHHKDGSRCTDAYCRSAHAIPLAAKVPNV